MCSHSSNLFWPWIWASETQQATELAVSGNHDGLFSSRVLSMTAAHQVLPHSWISLPLWPVSQTIPHREPEGFLRGSILSPVLTSLCPQLAAKLLAIWPLTQHCRGAAFAWSHCLVSLPSTDPQLYLSPLPTASLNSQIPLHGSRDFPASYVSSVSASLKKV